MGVSRKNLVLAESFESLSAGAPLGPKAVVRTAAPTKRADAFPLFSTADPAASRPQYEIINAKELARRWNLPSSWVQDQVRPSAKDPIPHLKLGRARFRWASPELDSWLDRRIVVGRQRRVSEFGAGAQPQYEVIDTREVARRWGVNESWLRDQVRVRCTDSIPHVRFGKYVRFRWGSPELEGWLERRMIGTNNRSVRRVG